MNKRRRYRAVLVLGTVGLLLTVACGLWLRSDRRQEALNRQLIAALVKGDLPPQFHYQYDDREALALVDAGADPNTPLVPSPAPSLRQLWNYVIHRSPLPANDSPSAFLIACGARWTTEDKMVSLGGGGVGFCTVGEIHGGAWSTCKHYGGETLDSIDVCCLSARRNARLFA